MRRIRKRRNKKSTRQSYGKHGYCCYYNHNDEMQITIIIKMK